MIRGRNSPRTTRNSVGLPKMMTAVIRWTTTIFFKNLVCHVILVQSGPFPDYQILLRTTRIHK